MIRQVCPDDTTLTLDGGGLLEVNYGSRFEMSSEGLAYKGSPGYFRSFSPTVTFNGAAMTMGASTMTGEYSVMQLCDEDGAPFFPSGVLVPETLFVVHFWVDLTFGAGFATPAGKLELNLIKSASTFGDAETTITYASHNVTANLIDASGTDYLYYGITGTTASRIEFRGGTGVRAANNLPFTWATGDHLTVSGWSLFSRTIGSLL